MPDRILRTFLERPGRHERERMLEDPTWEPESSEPLYRSDGSPVSLRAMDALLEDWSERMLAHNWEKASESDRWLAPRLHWAVRLTRAQAADKGVWLWLALRYPEYLERRWRGHDGIDESRWTGGINKQAFARLWWGAELFRDGSDYAPASDAFIRQDLINSMLHREIVRVRPIAVAMARYVVDGKVIRSADQVNDLAGVVNLELGGVSPEATLGWYRENRLDALDWLRIDPVPPSDHIYLPEGPPTTPVPAEVMAAAESLVDTCAQRAPAFARSKENRSATRAQGTARDRFAHLVDD